MIHDIGADRQQVLIVDDQLGEILWLLDRIRHRGYEVVVATNEASARERLDAVKKGNEVYAAAIIDVMVALQDSEDLQGQDLNLDEVFFEESEDTGIRLCRYARETLGITNRDLPIACLTVRDDAGVQEAMEQLGIPLYNRSPQDASESIMRFVECYLAALDSP